MADTKKPPPFRMVPPSIAAAAAAASKSPAGRLAPTSIPSEPETEQYNASQAYTYFTRPDGVTRQLYAANGWVRVKLALETAGPVVIGFKAGLSPMQSGAGRQLETDVEWECSMTRGAILYIVSESVNRVAITIEPIPWLQVIYGQLTRIAAVAERFRNPFGKK